MEAKAQRAKVEKENVEKAKAAKEGRATAWRSTKARAMLDIAKKITRTITPVTSLCSQAIWA